MASKCDNFDNVIAHGQHLGRRVECVSSDGKTLCRRFGCRRIGAAIYDSDYELAQFKRLLDVVVGSISNPLLNIVDGAFSGKEE